MKFHAVLQWVIGAAVAAATWSSGVEVRAAEAVPQVIVHEGQLVDAKGEPIVGVARTTFKLYDAPVGGRPIWSETVDVEFDDGYFSVWLGEATPLDESLLDGRPRWLGVAVGRGPEQPARAAVASTAHPMFADEVPVDDPQASRVPTVADADEAAPGVADADEPEPGEGLRAVDRAERPAGVVLDAAHADAVLGPLASAAEYAFIGASLHLDVEPGQVVHVSARAGLGSTAPGGAEGLELSICTRQAGTSRLLDNPGDRLHDLRVAANGRATFVVKTRFVGLAAGDHEFGLCGRIRAGSRWNDNDTSRVAVLVTTP